MTSPNVTVEVIEVTWKIPYNSLKLDNIQSHFKNFFFIGGRVPPGDPQAVSILPVKLEAWLVPAIDYGEQYHIVFSVSDHSKLPSSAVLLGKLLELRTLSCAHTVEGLKVEMAEPINFLFTSFHKHKHNLFQNSEIENHKDKNDGSLNIYFKLEITHNLPMQNTFAGGVDVLKNLECLLKESRNADVEIKVSQGGGQSFRCHKVILAARCPMFWAMLESDMKEGKENVVVEVDDILPKTMEHFLSFLYCGRFPDPSWIQWLPQLACHSDQYCMESLREICDLHLLRIVTLKNALTPGKVAGRHGLEKAEEDIRTCIMENGRELTFDIDLEMSNSDPNFNVVYSIPCLPSSDQGSHSSRHH